MRSRCVVVGKVGTKKSLEMKFVEDDDMIERLMHVATRSDGERPSTRVSDMLNKSSHVSLITTPKIVVDIYAGDLSLAKYYLRKYPQCVAICID